jgi:uncharacterized protein
MINNQEGFIKYIYLTLMFVFGVVFWVCVQSTMLGVLSPEKLNSKLMKVLDRGGVDQGKYVSQTAHDMQQGKETWKQFDKVFYVPKNTRENSIEKFLDTLDKFSIKNKLTLRRSFIREDRIEAKITDGEKTYFYLVMIPTETIKPIRVVEAAPPEPEETAQPAVQVQKPPVVEIVKAPPPPPPAPKKPEKKAEVQDVTNQLNQQPVPAETNKRFYPNASLAALVIEDAGGAENIDPFLELGIPITFAILPGQQNSQAIADKLFKKGIPFLVNIPMEPITYPNLNPGPNPMLTNMNAEQIKQNFEANLVGMAGAVGATNHMGSKFSENQDKMKLFLKLVSSRGLMYLDTVSTLDSKAEKAARDLRMPFKASQLYLDLYDDPDFISAQFEIFLKNAKASKGYIAVAHMNRTHLLQVLKEFIPKFEHENISFVFLSDF